MVRLILKSVLETGDTYTPIAEKNPPGPLVLANAARLLEASTAYKSWGEIFKEADAEFEKFEALFKVAPSATNPCEEQVSPPEGLKSSEGDE